ncbi:MAG: metalloregulator ArsR/SmtB family transcription factor [Bacteroidota bacterium]
MFTSKDFDNDVLEYAFSRLRGIAHPMRIEILELLMVNKQMTVTQIFEKMNVDQAVASHHLIILKNKGVVESNRSGKNSYYSIRESTLKLVTDSVETLMKK